MNPSDWITRFEPSIAPDGTVLDLACGEGRHARWFLARGHVVFALDRELAGVADLVADRRVELVSFDLECGEPLPLPRLSFAAVVVTNYLWRPILDDLVGLVAPGGWLLYETFAEGNERYGPPTNPDHLLRPGELLDVARRHDLDVVAYENVTVDEPRPAVLQRIAATRARPKVAGS
jgi:SAM-dependent methyltransferase